MILDNTNNLVAVQLRESSARHSPTGTAAVHSRRTNRNDSGRSHLLRGFPHNEARFRDIGSGCVEGVADDGRRRLQFRFRVPGNVAKLLPSDRGKEEAKALSNFARSQPW